MELNLPITVRTKKKKGATSYIASLVFEGISEEGFGLQRVLNRLTAKIKKNIESYSGSAYHRYLSSLLFYPDLKSHKTSLTFFWKTRIERLKFFLVSFPRFDKTIVFHPLIPGLFFDVENGETVQARAEEVYTDYFRDQEKKDGFRPSEFGISGEFWLSDITVQVRDSIKKTEDSKFLSLGQQGEMEGAVELDSVGRRLDSLYPDDLTNSIGREELSSDLDQLLQSIDRRPVLIVGESLVGKTALVHDVVLRRNRRRGQKSAFKNNVWKVSGQRIISGMSYVGQWENRIKVILQEIARKNHVFYCDDLLGLFRAGATSSSELTVGDKIKDAIVDRSVRFLGEITPAALERLKEVDRTFVDQFHVLRIEPTDEEETFKIGLQAVREAEGKFGCLFWPESVFSLIKFLRHYDKNKAFPGKLVKSIQSIASKNQSAQISQSVVIDEVSRSAGIAFDLLSDSESMKISEIEKKFGSRIIGQDEAKKVCCDVVSVVKAKLNDPRKPLATLLFVGPTGVGKTECAKALSQILYDRDDRLVRFDLNEFKSSYAASRLVGSIDRPDGLLTKAVQNQPSAVLLFDEIEKAHPDVFDILLQVFGEGRLTDANGRTADFTGCVIVMTSNLGTDTSGRTVGFENSFQKDHFAKAAKAFFRPEFLNRIDRVIPFESLLPNQISQIATQMMEKIVSRDGLIRRQCILQIDPEVMTNVLTKGYSLELGARALKRTIENEFTRPVATKLAGQRYDVPTLVRLGSKVRKDGNFQIEVYPLENTKPVLRPPRAADRNWAIERCQSYLSSVRESLLEKQPSGSISAGNLSKDQLHFYTVKEIVDSIETKIKDLKSLQLEAKDANIRPMIGTSRPKRKYNFKPNSDVLVDRVFLSELNSSQDILRLFDQQYQSFAEKNVSNDHDENQVQFELLNQCAFLSSVMSTSVDEVYWINRFSDCGEGFEKFAFERFNVQFKELESSFGYQYQTILNSAVSEKENDWLFCAKVSGAGIFGLVNGQQGVALSCNRNGKLGLIQGVAVAGNELPVGFDSFSIERQEKELIKALDSRPVGDVLQLIDFNFRILDFRTGQTGSLNWLRSLSLPSCFWE